MEFWETILCDGLFDFILGRKSQDLASTIKAYDKWLQAGGQNERLSQYQYQELQMLAGSSTFFITKAGRMGLSRSDVQTDNAIVLLGGETIPYILRPRLGTVSKHYAILGSCFCTGKFCMGLPRDEASTLITITRFDVRRSD
jgi:hypothetical protein